MSEQDLSVFSKIAKERKSVRKYDPSAVMPKEDLEGILTLASSSPSSWNLQHWRYFVIESKEGKERLLPIAYNQKQVVEAQVTVVLLGDLEANRSAVEVYGRSLKEGSITQEVYDTMIRQIDGAYKDNPQLARDEAILNTSLCAMQLMLAAKAYGYDTCPMGGFSASALVEAFQIPPRFIPVMLVTVGKARKPAHPTTRFDLDQLVIYERF